METASEAAGLEVERIGGIEETAVDLAPGVNVLVGRNATNRTSFLRAIMAAAGSTDVNVKGDADAGRVELTLGGETHERRLQPTGDGTVRATGEAYLSEPAVADMFAFLLATNPVRQAVLRGDDLREIIMEPIDTEAIEAEIDRLTDRRAELQAELDRIGELSEQLPGLQERLTTVEERIEETEAGLETKRERLESADESLEERRSEKEELDEKLEQLRSTRRERNRVASDIEIEEATVTDLREEIDQLEAERDELPAVPVEEIDQLEGEIDRLRTRKSDAEGSVTDLQRILQFNEDMLEGTQTDVVEEFLDGGDDGGSPTDELLEGSAVACWTCGTEVEQRAIEETCERLREARSELMERVNELDRRIEEAGERKAELERTRDRAGRIEDEVASLEAELSASRETLSQLKSRREALDEEIDRLEDEVDALEDDDYDELLALHREVNEHEFELEQLREERAEVREEIDRLEERLSGREQLEAELESVREEIVDQRTRIERIEEEAVEQFNAQMDDLLALLEYDNLERIWLEIQETEVREGRSVVPKRLFELHIVRRTDAGTVYEDTIDHLSESERELTGLVFALAGYLAHEVYEDCPFLLLDSLEAIDSDRIAALVEYVSDYAAFVVVALLPEDAQALDDGYTYHSEI